MIANLWKRTPRANWSVMLDKLTPAVTGENYRAALFDELSARVGTALGSGRFLEIGPKDGEDTVRLLQLAPQKFDLVDLADRQESNAPWLSKITDPSIAYHNGNIMYERLFDEQSFDLIWCTGVLYHNPEQLRMLRLLFDLLKPGGHLVLETATTRRRGLRQRSIVEVLGPTDQAYRKQNHLSKNINHLPSGAAVQRWLEMVGFESIVLSLYHLRQSRMLAANRVAFLSSRPQQAGEHAESYYANKDISYPIGRSL